MTAPAYQALVIQDVDGGAIAILEELECLAIGRTAAEALSSVRCRAKAVLQRYARANAAPPFPLRRSLVPLCLCASGVDALGAHGSPERPVAAPYHVSFDGRRTEQVLVMELLGTHRVQACSRAELKAELNNVDPVTTEDALARLAAAEVVTINGELVYPNPCTRHLDVLGMVTL